MPTDYVEDYEEVTGLKRGEQVVETKVVVAPEKAEVAPAKVAEVKKVAAKKAAVKKVTEVK